MARTPEVRSYEQILGDAISTYEAKRSGGNDLIPGGPLLSFLETNAQMVYRATGDIFQILKDQNVDRAKGEALRKIARDERVTILSASVTTGTVTLGDSSFDKIVTKVYTGSKPPNVGSTTIKVSDASDFPASGAVYLGRTTPNIEGPISYSNVQQVGSYWEITLDNPTTKFHNRGESVILSQGGNRNVPAGTVVLAPSSGAAEDIRFSTTENVTLLDGENTITQVPVVSQKTGSRNNVPSGAITDFASPPFSGATVINTEKFSTGRDEETNESLRTRIKSARLSKGLGTPLAIESATRGATAKDEAATITSNQIVTTDNTVLYVDNGEGYEAKTTGVGLEFIVDSALGGEDSFQLATGGSQTSVAKAFIESSNSVPFDVSVGDRIAVLVGGNVSEHTFVSGDFVSEGAATAFEIVASINANFDLLFQATTSDNGRKVVLSAKTEDDEFIQITEPSFGTDANGAMGFPTNEIETLRLYKNDVPLNKNGRSAILRTEAQSVWSSSIASGDTLTISVDGTSYITYTFTNSDFIEEGSHSVVSSSNTLSSWVNVINSKVTGITAEVDGEQIKINSNLGTSTRAAIMIDPSSTLVSKGMFTANQGLAATGLEADYTISRNTAQIKLKEPLSRGDKLTAGSQLTNGTVYTREILGGVVSLTSDAYLWLVLDDAVSTNINTGLVAGTFLNVTKEGSNTLRLSSETSGVFSNVQAGDYVIVWSEELSPTNRGEFRVTARDDDYLEFRVTATEYALATAEALVEYNEGIVVLRSEKTPKKIKVGAGTKNINDVASEIQSQLSGAVVDVDNDEVISISTNTRTEDGYVHVVTFDDPAKNLGFSVNDKQGSKTSLISFYQSGGYEGEFPIFVHGAFASEESAYPPDSYIASVDVDTDLQDYGSNFLLGVLNPYSSTDDVIAKGEEVQVETLGPVTLNIERNDYIKRLRDGDRYYLSSPFNFGHEDEVVVVLDADPTNKAFTLPLYRKLTTNTTATVSNTTFNAYDTESGPTASLVDSFGSSFDFQNYKALMRAKNVLDPSGTENSVLFRAAIWGSGGERYKVSYEYPTQPNLGITHTVSVDSEVDINIVLKSGNAVSTSIDGTTQWNVAITPNTPVVGVDQVTYSYSGTGTSPALGSLSGGEYVTIKDSSGFSDQNKGTFRVSDEVGFTPTPTSFTVARKSGEALAESAVDTLVSGSVQFYLPDATTAQEVVDYVTNNMSDYVLASILDDSGSSGSGVITYSTAEDSGFSYDKVYLVDGVNWVLSSDLASTPQFTFKKSLQVSSTSGYSFNEGTEIRLVPTTAQHIRDFLNILAVTGYTTLGSVKLNDGSKNIELTTDVLGSGGAVQVIGGSGNSVSVPVEGSSIKVGNDYMIANILEANRKGVYSGQWLELTALDRQNKITGFSSTDRVRIRPNTPTSGKTTIDITNASTGERHFGSYKNFVRDEGRTFRVEKQGRFVCVSHDGVSASPGFQHSVDLNDSGGGTMSVLSDTSTSTVTYAIESGDASFKELSFGDRVTFSGFQDEQNNGTFEVLGVSSDGKLAIIRNFEAVTSLPKGTITITNNANVSADSFTVGSTTLTEGVDFSAGATADDTAANLAAVAAVITGVNATASSNVVTITALSQLDTKSLSYTDSGSGVAAAVSGPVLEGESFTDSELSASAFVREGDSVTMGEPFDILNQGTFRVIRTYGDSFYIENDKAVEEMVTVVENLRTFGGDGMTTYRVVSAEGNMRVEWDGSGTEPDFGSLKAGDVATLGTDFDASNQGQLSVFKSRSKQQQITLANCVAGTEITTGDYFLLNAAGDSTQYYVWYNVDGGGGDPSIGGKTGVMVAINAVDSSDTVASKTRNVINALGDFSATVSSSSVTITTAGYDTTTDASDGNIGGNFSVDTLQSGNTTFVEFHKSYFTPESGITITDEFNFHIPGMKFREYEASVPGDLLNITTESLGGSGNVGVYAIEEVVDKSRVILGTNLSTLEETPLLNNSSSLFVEEGVKYSGFKKVVTTAVNTGNANRLDLIFDSQENADKINSVGRVQLGSVSKLSFPSGIKRGLDSYRYHTGLIAEANRIVYGDPRDNVTYPGVGAAGAEIFVQEPLKRRITVSISVRVKTGIPFARISEQVRNVVSSLINSNDVGSSIAISSIVSAVNSIPGVRAVSIDSPQYDSSNDVISVQPSEKTLVLDSVNDIIVSQVG